MDNQHQMERPPVGNENRFLSDQDLSEMVQVNVDQESRLLFPEERIFLTVTQKNFGRGGHADKKKKKESLFPVLDEIFQDRANPPVADTGCLQFEGQDMIMFQVGAVPQSVNEIMPTQLERSGLQQGQLALEDHGSPNPSVDFPLTTVKVDEEVSHENIENHWDSQVLNDLDLDEIPLGPGLVSQQGEAEQEQPQESTSSSSVNENLETGPMEVDDDLGNTVGARNPNLVEFWMVEGVRILVPTIRNQNLG